MNSRNIHTEVSQTEFVDQAQLLEADSGKKFKWQDLKNNKNLRPFYVLIGLFFFVVFIFVLRLLMQAPPEQPKEFERAEELVELSPLNKRVYDLREELKEHNPTRQRLPFPQVDLEFNIY